MTIIKSFKRNKETKRIRAFVELIMKETARKGKQKVKF